MYNKRKEIRIIYTTITVFFIIFLLAPLMILLINSFKTGNGIRISNYVSVIGDSKILTSIGNSIKVSSITAIITTIMAFTLSYVVNCTNVFKWIKDILKIGISVPMLLPTITYGFAIIYSFGKQGLLTKLFGRELCQIYGFNGLLMGYVIYTLPSAFLLINNSFGYIDKKYIIVSKLLGDGVIRNFSNTILRPLIGTLGGSFVLSFILSFTDFGIPASVGGNYSVVSTHLYEIMLGSIPDFNSGSVVSILMLMPSVFGVLLLNYLDKFNFHYDKSTKTEIMKNLLRDVSLGFISILTVAGIISIFLIMFIAPFAQNFPYDMSFTTKFFKITLLSPGILEVYRNSFMVAVISALSGTLVTYAAAIVNIRTNINKKAKVSLDVFSMITNTVPGMVLGLSYLLFFNGSDFKRTFIIIIICNIVHFFTTPYLMAKNSFSKMNPAWETTGELLGDTWIKTVIRVIIPSSISTIVEMFSYYFINSMVTISAIIFLVTARTSVITSNIKQLQHFGNFNEIFVLSILIFVTNIFIKICCDTINKKLSIHR
ncbi:ABC transporter permease subunit [Clostridium sporogenes]|uniref:ABC transporter permease subunit n=1 Tax=Clostridium sporogenes TaxID=1509 RepID=UPI0015EE9114|nr:ABC transporter permease subunit [Clostridium sporogenes]MBA4508034.1 ABC transporter permease subunit [Clostridium sporogenes]